MEDLSELTTQLNFCLSAAINLHPDSFGMKIEFVTHTTSETHFGRVRGMGFTASVKVFKKDKPEEEIASYSTYPDKIFTSMEFALENLIEQIKEGFQEKSEQKESPALASK